MALPSLDVASSPWTWEISRFDFPYPRRRSDSILTLVLCVFVDFSNRLTAYCQKQSRMVDWRVEEPGGHPFRSFSNSSSLTLRPSCQYVFSSSASASNQCWLSQRNSLLGNLILYLARSRNCHDTLGKPKSEIRHYGQLWFLNLHRRLDRFVQCLR